MAYRKDIDEDMEVVLVTGGAGWLGTHLVKHLLRLGGPAGGKQVKHVHICDVVKAGIPQTTEGEGEGEDDARFTSHVLDLRDAHAVRALVLACQPRVIFHLASVVDVRPFYSHAVYDINVQGTVNMVLAATACHQTHAFVYCSTLDVVYCGRPMELVEETLPYTEASSFPRWVPGSSYPPSKARAEQVVLSADASTTAKAGLGLRTCALRPGHLFGERDAILSFFSKLPLSVAGPPCQMTMQYVGNAAVMHVLAARRLLRERRQGDKGISMSSCKSNDDGWAERAKVSDVLAGRAVNMGDFEESFTQFYGRQLQPQTPGHRPPILLPLPVFVLFTIGLVLDLLDFLLIVLAIILTPLAVVMGLCPRGRSLCWRLPRHPALCLASSTALESTIHHSTNRQLGCRLFGHQELYGGVKASGGVGLVSREESMLRTRRWIEGQKGGKSAAPMGYSFSG